MAAGAGASGVEGRGGAAVVDMGEQQQQQQPVRSAQSLTTSDTERGFVAGDTAGTGSGASMQQHSLSDDPGAAARGSAVGSGAPLRRQLLDAPALAAAPPDGQQQPMSADGGALAELPHPCMHAGYAANYTRTRDYGVATHMRMVTLVGAPDWAACEVRDETSCVVTHQHAPMWLGTVPFLDAPEWMQGTASIDAMLKACMHTQHTHSHMGRRDTGVFARMTRANMSLVLSPPSLSS